MMLCLHLWRRTKCHCLKWAGEGIIGELVCCVFCFCFFFVGWTRWWEGDTECQFDHSPCLLLNCLCSPPPSRLPSGQASRWPWHGRCYQCPVRGLNKPRGEQKAKGGFSDSKFNSQRGFFFTFFHFLLNWLLGELQAFSLCLLYYRVLFLQSCCALTTTLMNMTSKTFTSEVLINLH